METQQYLNNPHHYIEYADIFIYKFHNAPEELKALSEHGGDEDYIIVMSKDFFYKEYGDHVVDRLTIWEYDKYELGEVVVCITCHN